MGNDGNQRGGPGLGGETDPTRRPGLRRRSPLQPRSFRWRSDLTSSDVERARQLLAQPERSFDAVAAELGVVPRVLARHLPPPEGMGQRKRLRPKLVDNGGQTLKAEIAAQISAALRENGISQRTFANLIGKTSGAVQNLLNPDTNVTLANLARAAAALGLELRIELKRISEPDAGGTTVHPGRQAAP